MKRKNSSIRRVRLKDLSCNPLNPATRTIPSKLKGMVRSIKKMGIIQPPIVTSDLFIVDGHRRITASHIIDSDGELDVLSSGTLDVLMEAGWIKLAGRREVPGRPVIYATTNDFLDHFGLESRRDLPGIDELKAAGLLDPVDEAFDEAMGAQDCEADEDASEDAEEDAES